MLYVVIVQKAKGGRLCRVVWWIERWCGQIYNKSARS